MKKKFSPIAILMLILVLLLCSCGTTPENENEETTIPTETVEETTIPTETVEETTEAESELDPEWLSDAAIDEAYACLFPSEGEINVEKAQEILLPLVEAGNAEAQYYWGYICDLYLADNTGELEEEALYWYELSAKQGFPKAFLAAAANECLDSEELRNSLIESAKQTGALSFSTEELGADGCDLVAYYFMSNNDYPSAAEWFLKSAELGSTIGMMNYGQMHYYKLGVEQNYVIAADWLQKAAEAGNINAMYLYGYVLSDWSVADAIVDQKYTSSLDEYMAAAEADDPEAMYRIGIMYDKGYGGLKYSTETAFEWYQKAAKAGHPEAMYILGYAYDSGYLDIFDENVELAVEWYRKAAEAGNGKAMEELGQHYYQGKGVEKDDALGSEWYQKAREIIAQQNEALFSDRGKLLKKAMEWHQKAADAGLIDSMNEIVYYAYEGFMRFYDGDYGSYSKSYSVSEPKLFYHELAEAGSPVAMYYLAKHLEWYDEDYDEAMKWFIKAYAQGYSDAAKEIYEMLVEKQGLNAYYENYEEMMSANH